MNKKAYYLAFTTAILFFLSCNLNKKQETSKKIKVLSLNTWHQGTKVDNGYNAIVNVIVESKADIVMLQEIRNHNEVNFSNQILKSLKDKGITFYSNESKKSPFILSKYPIISTDGINSGSVSKAVVKIDEQINATIYSVHLDHTHYACYLPRGYDGITWKKLAEPITDINAILKQNKNSKRDEAIAVFLEDANSEIKNGNIVLLGGDFNEPSHLDWTEATKNLFDHNGTVVPWHNSITLKKNGYIDTYRELYPNPVSHPGFTWTANNVTADLSHLIWTPEADDRERIDFIYYYPHKKLQLQESVIVGPVGSIVKGKRVETNPGEDKFFTPKGIWPTDHKGVLSTFSFKK